MTRGAAIVSAAALLVLTACGESDGDDGSTLFCAGAECSQACQDLAGAECDVREADCQKRIVRAVRCVRGGVGHLPAIRTLSEDEWRQELLADAMADGGSLDGGAPDGGAPDAGDEPDPWSLGLALLGLLPPDVDLQSASIESSSEAVAGVYQGDERGITLVDRGRAQDDWQTIRVFAHELVHALQDQSLGFSQLWSRGPTWGDGAFARGCLIEGEADLTSALALALLQGVSIDEAGFDAELRSELKYTRKSVVTSRAPYAALWQLRYPIGTRYLFDAFRADGHWAVQALFEAPPSSTIHWMVGYEQNLARREPLVRPLACELAATPPGYTLYNAGSLGAAVLYAFLAHNLRTPEGVLTSEEQWRNALRWRQDSLSVFADEAGQVAVSYRVRFDDAGLASWLAAALPAVPELTLRTVQHGDELEILAAEDAALLEGWATDPDACPPVP